MRIYKVAVTGEDKARLVMAQNPAQAIRFVAANMFEVSAATSIEVANLMSGGVKVENGPEEVPAEAKAGE